MGKTLIRILAVILLLALMAVLVPSATPVAIGEGVSGDYTARKTVMLESVCPGVSNG